MSYVHSLYCLHIQATSELIYECVDSEDIRRLLINVFQSYIYISYIRAVAWHDSDGGKKCNGHKYLSGVGEAER